MHIDDEILAAVLSKGTKIWIIAPKTEDGKLPNEYEILDNEIYWGKESAVITFHNTLDEKTKKTHAVYEGTILIKKLFEL